MQRCTIFLRDVEQKKKFMVPAQTWSCNFVGFWLWFWLWTRNFAKRNVHLAIFERRQQR